MLIKLNVSNITSLNNAEISDTIKFDMYSQNEHRNDEIVLIMMEQSPADYSAETLIYEMPKAVKSCFIYLYCI